MMVRRVRWRVPANFSSTVGGGATSTCDGVVGEANAAPDSPCGTAASTKYSTPGALTASPGIEPRR